MSTSPPAAGAARAARSGGVACFGSGRVAYPLVEFLTRDASAHLTLVSDDALQLASFASRISRLHRANLTIETMAAVDTEESLALITDFLKQRAFACAVALVPEDAQYTLARACIATNTPLVTASYVSPRIRQLHQAAIDADIPLLCECGLDPGLDHMGAVDMIASIQKASRGVITKFTSVCGGLPAPESATNPLGYKFTWAPLGALRALQRSAQFKECDRTVSICGRDLLSHAMPVRTIPALALEQLPNGDAIPYAKLYGIPDVPTIFRGTYRYRGFCAIMRDCVALGLLDDAPLPSTNVTTWSHLLAAVRAAKEGLCQAVETNEFFAWIGDDVSTRGGATCLAAFANVLEQRLAMALDDRDLVVLTHAVEVDMGNGAMEVHTASLIGYGDHESTFMAKSVGVTAAVVTQLVVEGRVKHRGILAPTTPDVYTPALAALEKEGIRFDVHVTRRHAAKL
ncbi:hypothetical protein H310_08864 [Aphanomyces invadans]|uniref:Saccharopine dehydrogenase n=1 Tax=Aphanomyces invadans TaxID=157072 RepID=A0A024TVB4_9STRA|nr:hypothetical protein H310_08864 [Aphanomyces invadans]ETV98120.1 hypothetical protein H310_08864 [Aphanomyces invadans]|eukprot:XP_008872995.1 hypothetical protein H310_08864 [Aphanomyces invadans]